MDTSSLMEQILSNENLNAAYLQVAYKHNYKWLRAVLMAWRSHRRGKVPFVTALRWVSEGIAYAKSIGR